MMISKSGHVLFSSLIKSWRCDYFTWLLSDLFTKHRHVDMEGMKPGLALELIVCFTLVFKKQNKNKTDKGEQTWFSVPVWQEHASSHFACMWVTHTVPSCSAESAAPPLRPPTSAPQKQSPAFSSQMEVTPYASKPLSLCHGSSTNTSRGNKEREEDVTRSAHQRRAGVHLLKVLCNDVVCWIFICPDNGLAARSAPMFRQVYLRIHMYAKCADVHAVNTLTLRSQQNQNSHVDLQIVFKATLLHGILTHRAVCSNMRSCRTVLRRSKL